VGRDYELRVVQDQVVYARQDGKLPLWRKRGLRFVKDVHPLTAKSFGHQRKEGLAVRLFVQRATAVGVDNWRPEGGFSVELLNFCGDVEETFRTQKKAVTRSLYPLATRRYSCNSECEPRVPKRKFFVPPSGLKPRETAMASSSVDLPDPFSPTKKVTFG